MKKVYPWAEMQPGEVREVTSKVKLSAVRQAAYEYCKRRRTEDGSGPAFNVTTVGWDVGLDESMVPGVMVGVYRIERTA